MLQFKKTFYVLIALIPFTSFAQDSTYRGKEFWAGYGHHQFMEPGQSNNQELAFYLCAQNQPAIVTITVDSATVPWSRTYNVAANSVVISDLIPKSGSSDARLYSIPVSLGGTSSTGLFRRKGIHIQSDVPIAVYSHLYGSASAGASLLLPVSSWGYTYQSVNSAQRYASNCFSWAYVIAQADSTLVEITPSQITRAQTLTGLQAGVATNILLQKGQIYAVLGDIVGSGPDGYELTGTKIRSLSTGKPIAVFSGSSRTSNPASCGSGGGDNDMVQVFPFHIWGNNYLTAPLPSSSSASFASTSSIKIMVNDPTTVVTRNGVALTGLINNSYYKYESNTADYIRADKPIMVAQFISGGGCTQGLGDPEMFYLSPIEGAIKKATGVRTNREGISINYALVIIPTTGISSLLIDGSATFNHSYAHPNIPGYSVVIKSWTSAVTQFTVQSDSAFTGLSFGMGPVESYGYNLGADFQKSNDLDPLVRLAWTGGQSTDWFNANNWNMGRIPNATDVIFIPAGKPFSPHVPAGQIAHCKSITVEQGANVTVGINAQLDITKN